MEGNKTSTGKNTRINLPTKIVLNHFRTVDIKGEEGKLLFAHTMKACGRRKVMAPLIVSISSTCK